MEVDSLILSNLYGKPNIIYWGLTTLILHIWVGWGVINNAVKYVRANGLNFVEYWMEDQKKPVTNLSIRSASN